VKCRTKPNNLFTKIQGTGAVIFCYLEKKSPVCSELRDKTSVLNTDLRIRIDLDFPVPDPNRYCEYGSGSRRARFGPNN